MWFSQGAPAAMKMQRHHHALPSPHCGLLQRRGSSVLPPPGFSHSWKTGLQETARESPFSSLAWQAWPAYKAVWVRQDTQQAITDRAGCLSSPSIGQ